MSFKDTIRRFFMIYTIIPLSILIVLFLIFSIFNSKQVVTSEANHSSENISSILEGVNEAYLQEISKMSTDRHLIDFINYRKDRHLVFEKFYNFNNQQIIRSNVFIFNNEGVLLLSNAGNSDDISQNVIDSLTMSKRNIPYNGTLSAANTVMNLNGRLSVYLYGRHIVSEGDQIGYLFYLLHEDDFQEIIFNEPSNIIVITDQYDTIISTTNNRVRGFLNRFRPEVDNNGNAVYGESTFYMSERVVPNSQIHVIALNSLQHQSTLLFWLIIFLVIVTILLMLVLRHMSTRLSTNVTVSIDKMLYAIKQFQSGDMNYYLNIKSGDEFEILAKQYNAMVDRINQLINQNIELSERRRLTEVKHLESQFNPHFIFNVLETIRYSVVIDQNQAQQSILALSRLLRYSIENDKTHVKLVEDINYLKDYLSLHKIRFNEQLQYSIELEEKIENILVPKLLIQPLVENSIKHGYAHQDHLCIEVKVYLKGEKLHVSVTDNGGGMEPSLLQGIQQALNNDHIKNEKMGIGLYNVHRRLVLLYKENNGIHIENTEDGLNIQFSIPTEE